MPTLFHRLLAPRPRTIQRDTIRLVLGDGRNIEVARVRDPRARRLRLSVDERGARLTLPLRASLVSGEQFLAEHRQWLALQLDRHAIQACPPLLRDHTATLPLRGAMLPLRWTNGRCTRLQRDGDTLQFAVPARAGEAALRRPLRDFYEGEARADLGRWLPRYLPSLPRAPTRVQFKVMSSQWGSLAPDGTLVLDLALVLGRPSAFEYVLVHELCHLIRADHSRGFWNQVEKRFPAWRDERDYFQAEGRRLKATLRALLG